MTLQQRIEELYGTPVEDIDRNKATEAIAELKSLLNDGTVRAARAAGDVWEVNVWVKKGILLGFRLGVLKDQTRNGSFRFFDKDTMALRTIELDDAVRIVPGGTAVRDGVHLGSGVIIMPPAYVNIGAFVDEGTMIDSHVLVGSCAQIGKNVHLSAGAQIGGVLEPVGAMPVIIEDEALVGGNCGVYEGAVVRRRAVLAAGVILTGSTPVYDVVHKQVYRRTASRPLTIPENAVVVPGSRISTDAWASKQGLSLYSPLIVKYRDTKTDASTALEDSLR